MPEAVVADSTVLIFLGKLRRLDWLRAEYDPVLVPTEVYEEVVVNGKELGARDAVLVESAIEDGWIEVHEIDRREDIRKYDLEAGETEVLSLALARGHDEVLADEESVREVARLHDLRPRGTLYFLFTAVRDAEITFDEFLELLEKFLAAGFYLDEAIYLEAIRKARQLADEPE
jgi:predicted nucleic acid-binding protein